MHDCVFDAGCVIASAPGEYHVTSSNVVPLTGLNGDSDGRNRRCPPGGIDVGLKESLQIDDE